MDKPDLPDPSKFNDNPLELSGDTTANPAIDQLLQMLDIGEVIIGRHDMTEHSTSLYPEPQMLTVEVRRRTDGATFSAAMILSRQMPPTVFKLALVHLLTMGVDRVKRG